MRSVSIRDLLNNVSEVLSRIGAGATLHASRAERPVAVLTPLPRIPLSTEELLNRARALPAIDADRFRADIDGLIDQMSRAGRLRSSPATRMPAPGSTLHESSRGRSGEG